MAKKRKPKQSGVKKTTVETSVPGVANSGTSRFRSGSFGKPKR